MAGDAADLEAQPQRLPPPEGPPSLVEKIVNLRETWHNVPSDRLDQEFRAIIEKHFSDWEPYWLDCASPLVAEFLDAMQMVAQREGDVYLAPTFRRCGKTTMGMILKQFCKVFSTPEKPLPQFHFFNPEGIASPLIGELEKIRPQEGNIDHDKEKEIIRHYLIDDATMDDSVRNQPPEEKRILAETLLREKEIVFFDEAAQLAGARNWPAEERARTLLSCLEVLKELCPKAVVFVTTGHGIGEDKTVGELFNDLYNANINAGEPLKMFERGLRDAWTTEAVMAYFFGREKTEPSAFDFRADSAVFQAWLANRVIAALRGYFNPFILSYYLRYYDTAKHSLAEEACQREETRLKRPLDAGERQSLAATTETKFEKALANLYCLEPPEGEKEKTQDSARKLLAGQYELRQTVEKPTGIKSYSHRLYSLDNKDVLAVAKVYGLDPQDFLRSVISLRKTFDHGYSAAIDQTLPEEALKAKLQIAERVEANLAARLLTERGKELGEQTPEQILADFLQILSGTEFSLRARGVAKEHEDILLPEPKSGD